MCTCIVYRWVRIYCYILDVTTSHRLSERRSWKQSGRIAGETADDQVSKHAKAAGTHRDARNYIHRVTYTEDWGGRAGRPSSAKSFSCILPAQFGARHYSASLSIPEGLLSKSKQPTYLRLHQGGRVRDGRWRRRVGVETTPLRGGRRRRALLIRVMRRLRQIVRIGRRRGREQVRLISDVRTHRGRVSLAATPVRSA